ncbi:MAG TPA: hypothetical protein PKZ19_02640 [Zoogloea sp.]|nr:hypothetical protein [Zoogloea sp.]
MALNTSHPLYPYIESIVGVDPVTKRLVDHKGNTIFTMGGGFSVTNTTSKYGYPVRLNTHQGSAKATLSSPVRLRKMNSTIFLVLGNPFTPGFTYYPSALLADNASSSGRTIGLDSGGVIGIYPNQNATGHVWAMSATDVHLKAAFTAAFTLGGADSTGVIVKSYIDGVLDRTNPPYPDSRGNGEWVESKFISYGTFGQVPGATPGGGDFYWIITFNKLLSDAEILELHNGTGSLNTSSLLAGGAGQTPTVTGVVITGGNVTMTGSESRMFVATVQGTNNPSQAVTWAASSGTINSSTGAFVAPFASASVQTITVTATSVEDNTKSASITVSVPAGGTVTPVNVTGISVTPRQAEVLGGQQLQLIVNVAGTGNPSQAVTWVVSGGSVNATGVWTAPAATGSATTYTVTATSQANPTYSASVVLTVPAVAAAGQFLTDRMINNAGMALGNASIAWTWVPGRQVGGIAGATLVEGTGNTDALGQLLVTGLPAGAGILLAKSGSAVFYQEGLVA